MASADLSAAEHVSGNVGLLLNVSEGMVTKDMDRVEVLNIFFAFGSSTSLRLVGKSGARQTSSVEGDQVREYLSTLCVFEFERLTRAEGAGQHQ